MRKIILSAAVLTIGMVSCKKETGMMVTVSNPLLMERLEEMVEVSADDVYKKLNLTDTSEFIIVDENNLEVPYQITYDGNIIFPASVGAESTSVYKFKLGEPAPVNTLVYGRHYPERLDDIAWENDKAAYRAYGPALQATGEKAYGYDILTKSVSELVVEDRYARDLDSDARAKIKELRESGKNEEAQELADAISYHIDHGNGMDCYAVGPTLGGGTSALMPDSVIAYPYCYKEYEILDNGPLRFTVKLEYNPMTIAADTNVVETRIIQLDRGSHLNKATVNYSSVSKDYPVAAGIVLHEAHPDRYYTDRDNGYVSYADPTTDIKADNGIVYVGLVLPNNMEAAKVQKFEKPVGGALGHLLGISTYQPGYDFVYYWGSAWSKCGFDDDKWNQYLKEYSLKVKNPLVVTVK